MSSNSVFKFHNDPTVNESDVIVLLGQVWMYAKKKEDFGRGGRENEFERNKV